MEQNEFQKMLLDLCMKNVAVNCRMFSVFALKENLTLFTFILLYIYIYIYIYI